MSDEDRLRARLREQVAAIPVVADLDDVAARIGRGSHRRERMLVVVAVVGLLVGTIGGFAAGRAGRGNSRSVTVAGPANSSGTTTTDTGVPRPTVTDSGPVRTLPAPGPEQPSDVSAARQAVSQAFADAFDGGVSDPVRVQAIEGGSELVAVFDQLRRGSFGTQVAAAKTVIEGIVFLSPSSAAVEFHSDLGPDGRSGPYFGDGVLTPTGWLVSHTSYCEIITSAGVRCP
jgi:hypothetical protein